MEIAEMTVVIMKKLSEGVVARYIGVDHAKRRWYHHIIMNTKKISQLKKIAVPILRSKGVEYAALFGSAARGADTQGSDVDILVRFSKPVSLLKHVNVAFALQDALRKKVDVITEQSLNRYLVPHIKADLHVLYGKGKRR